MKNTIQRRQFLANCGKLCFGFALFHPLSTEALQNQQPRFASAYMDSNRNFGIAILDEQQNLLEIHPLPARGHGMACNVQNRWLVTFARRPENFALALDLQKIHAPTLFKTPPDRHFYGHGSFSQDGKLLFATENDFENERGIIGIYDATDSFHRIGEIESGGIGPHEILCMPDKKTLCVANGGILTHPNSGRTKLNLSEMQSSLCFVDSSNGDLIQKWNVPKAIHRLSLRHMAVDSQQRIWLGGQYQGALQDTVPLIATADWDQGLEFLNLAPNENRNLSNYVGSVAVSNNGERIGFSSPKGNALLIVDAKTKQVVANQKKKKICGIAPHKNDFLKSTLEGKLESQNFPFYWDNHLLAL